MATELDKLHCRVLAMRQESALRQQHFVEKDMLSRFVTEQSVGMELDRILSLFDSARQKAYRDMRHA